MMFLDTIYNWADIRLNTVKKIKELNYPVVIYGAGVNAVYTVKFLKQYNISPLCFCDDNENINEFLGRPVYTYTELRKKYPHTYSKLYIIIAIHQQNNTIYLKLINNDEMCICRCLYPDDILDDKGTDYDFVLKNELKFEQVYHLLEDQHSKETLTNIINYKISGRMPFLASIYRNKTYFDDVINLSNDEVFVDCGAFDGYSIHRFIQCVSGYKKIIAFEPDINTFTTLRQNTANFDNIELYNIGVWNANTTLDFHNTSLPCSNVSDTANTTVIVNKLDHIIDEKITILKMDVEGAEIKALEGAKEIIKKYKPKLAICVYHRKTDIFDIPFIIKDLVPTYKLYLRHHAKTSSDETVLYAIP